MMKKVLYLLPDYGKPTLKSLSFLLKLNCDVHVVAPYNINQLNRLLKLFRVNKKRYPKLHRRMEDWKKLEEQNVKIISIPIIQFISTVLIEMLFKKKLLSTVFRSILSKSIIHKIQWDKYEYLYCFDTSALQFIHQAKSSDLKVILESRGSHIDHSLDIQKKISELYQIPRKKSNEDELAWYNKLRMEPEFSDYILTYSNYHCQQFIDRGFFIDKILNVPIASKFNKREEIIEYCEKDKLTFVFLGSISASKGYLNLICAWKNILKKHPNTDNIQLKFIGKIDPELTASCFSHPSIKYLGYLYNEDIIRELKNSHVFVFPTFNDSYAMVIQEAISYNLPIITTVNCGASDFISDGENGLIVEDPFSITELQIKIEFFINNPSQVKKMSGVQKAMPAYTEMDELGKFQFELEKVGIYPGHGQAS